MEAKAGKPRAKVDKLNDAIYVSLAVKAFTANDTYMASLSLSTFALGLPAFASIKVLAPGFYSRQDTKTPMRFALYAIAFNLLFNLLIVVPWIWKQLPAGHAVLALAAASARTA